MSGKRDTGDEATDTEVAIFLARMLKASRETGNEHGISAERVFVKLAREALQTMTNRFARDFLEAEIRKHTRSKDEEAGAR